MPDFSSILSRIGNIGTDILKSKSNKNVYLKDSRIAAKQFNFGNAGLDSRVPRVKYLFFVNFISPRPELTKNYNDFGTGISLLVKSFSKPGFSIKADVLNQYNKKRIVQTGIEYDPITITFYNTYDKKVIDTINDYMRFYYGDFKAEKSSAWNNDIIAPIYQYIVGSSPMNGVDWGFNFPPLFSKNTTSKTFDMSDSYFFSEINLYQFGSNYVDKFTFVNPKITKVNFDTEDYSDGSADTISITILFEGMILREKFDGKNYRRLNAQDAEAFGFNYSDFNNINFPCYNNNIELANKNFVQNNFSNINNTFPKTNSATSILFSQNNQSPNSNSSLNKNVSPLWYDDITGGKNISPTSSAGINVNSISNVKNKSNNNTNNIFNFFI